MTNDQRPTTSESTHQPIIYGMLPEQSGDEISLIDLFLVIKRRKKSVFYAVFIFTILSTVFALAKSDVYRYAASIEIGSRLVNNKIVKIDSPATVLAKLTEGYIPLVLAENLNANTSKDTISPKISGRIPKGSEIIVLETKGVKEHEDVYVRLLIEVIKKIKDDHKLIVLGIRKKIEININKISRQVIEQEAELNIQVAMLKRQDDIAKLIKQDIDSTSKTLESALKSREEALRETSEESKALTLMFLTSEIRNTQKDVASLKERLHVKLPGVRDRLNKKIQDIKGVIEGHSDQISKLVLEKESIQETRALTAPIRSLKPVGTGKSVIVILGTMVGLFFGIMLVFVAEMSKKVREVEAVNN